MVRPKSAKNASTEEGPAEVWSLPNMDSREESSVPADKVLFALETLLEEMAQSKKDICATIDARIGSVKADLTNEISIMKRDTQTAMAAIKATMLAHSEKITEDDISRCKPRWLA